MVPYGERGERELQVDIGLAVESGLSVDIGLAVESGLSVDIGLAVESGLSVDIGLAVGVGPGVELPGVCDSAIGPLPSSGVSPSPSSMMSSSSELLRRIASVTEERTPPASAAARTPRMGPPSSTPPGRQSEHDLYPRPSDSEGTGGGEASGTCSTSCVNYRLVDRYDRLHWVYPLPEEECYGASGRSSRPMRIVASPSSARPISYHRPACRHRRLAGID